MIKPHKDFVQELLQAAEADQYLPDHTYGYGNTKSCSERDPGELILGGREVEHKVIFPHTMTNLVFIGD